MRYALPTACQPLRLTGAACQPPPPYFPGDPIGDDPSLGISEIRVLHFSAPKLPRAAKKLNITDETCEVHVTLSTDGVPTDVQVERCSPVFHQSILKVAWDWRFQIISERQIMDESQDIPFIT